MKILQVIGSLSERFGGPSKVALELSQALTMRGHQVVIFTTDRGGRGSFLTTLGKSDFSGMYPSGPILFKGVEIWYFGVNRPKQWVTSYPMAKALSTRIKEFDVVEIHSLYVFPTSAAAYYCRKAGIPYLIRPHGSLDPFLRNKSRFKKYIYNSVLEKRNLNHAAAIHYTSKEEMDLAHDALRIRAPGVVVPLGLFLEDYSRLPPPGTFRSQFPEIGNKFLILFLNRINFKKGIDILVRAYGTVARRRNDVHLVIAGPDNEGYARYVKQWLAREGVLDRVTFTGMILGDEKLSALRDSDLFVLPSYTENFGVGIVEAMACGLAVVISNRVNIWREIEEYSAGLVISCDSDELAKALIELLDEPDKRERLGRNGRKLVGEKFTWDRIAEQMIEVYHNCIDQF